MFIFGDKHRKVRHLLSAYLDDELKARDRDLVEKHLATCHACRQEMESLRATVALLKRLPMAIPGRSFLVQAEKRSRPRPAPPIWQPVPVPVIITILLTVALFLGDILNALPYSQEGIVSLVPSAPVPMAATQARPEANVLSPTPSPSPKSPELLKPGAPSGETPGARALSESKAPGPPVRGAGQEPEGVAAGASAPAAAPPSAAVPQGPAGPAAPAGPLRSPGKDAQPAPPMLQLKGAPSTTTPGGVLEPGPQPPEAMAAQGQPLPQPVPVPPPVPQATLLPQPTLAPAPVLPPPLLQTPVSQMKAEEPVARAVPGAGQDETARGQVSAAGPSGNLFVIPWRLIEVFLAALSVLIITITIVKRRTHRKKT